MKINLLIEILDINKLESCIQNCKIVQPKKNRLKRQKRKYNPQRISNPKAFYDQLGIELKGRGEWRTAKCPFHNDIHPSLSININHGGFKCHACGISGDMVRFYMDFKNVDFITACDALDLWEMQK